MGFLDNLLYGVEVEWTPLASVTSPTSNMKWKESKTAFQYIDLTSVDIKTKRITSTNEIDSQTAPSRAQKIVIEEDILFATTRPTQMRYCQIGEEYSGQVASTGYCVLRAITQIVQPRWILHWLSSRDFKEYLEEHQSGAAYPAISDGKVKAFQIPIPCPENPEKSLAIQAEIVRILDTFTELTTELTTELNARQKQYNYYRDKLLSFDEEVSWKQLGGRLWSTPQCPKT